MRLAGVRIKPRGLLDGHPRQVAARFRVIQAFPVKVQMRLGQQTPGLQEFRIALQRLAEQIDGFEQALARRRVGIEALQFPGVPVELEGQHILCRQMGELRLFRGRYSGAQLLGDGLGNLALDAESIVERPVVALRPERRGGAGVDQLGIHPHLAGDPLHAALEQVRDAELLRDLAQIARCPGFVLHHAGAADHFEVRDLRQVGQDFVLHAVGEKRVLLVVAQVFKRQHGDALGRDRCGRGSRGRAAGGGGGTLGGRFRRGTAKLKPGERAEADDHCHHRRCWQPGRDPAASSRGGFRSGLGVSRFQPKIRPAERRHDDADFVAAFPECLLHGRRRRRPALRIGLEHRLE